MNYDAYTRQLADATKDDKSIVQPWRNYALKSLAEYRAFVRMGKTTTYVRGSQGVSGNETSIDTFLSGETIADPSVQATATQSGLCICTPGMPARRDCPMHKGVA